mgnify:CR=1 FL=1
MNEETIETNENIEGVQTEEKPKGERMFTSEEVNSIVRERLKRVKAKAADDGSEARTKELDEREATLTAREKRLSCREYLRDNGLSDDLLDVFSADDAEVFIEKVNKARDLLGGSSYPIVDDGGELHNTPDADNILDVFLNTPAHKPKEYNPFR